MITADGLGINSRAVALVNEAASSGAGQQLVTSPVVPWGPAAGYAAGRESGEVAAADVSVSPALTAGVQPLLDSYPVTSESELPVGIGRSEAMQQQQQADDWVTWTDEMSAAVAMMDRALGTYVESPLAQQWRMAGGAGKGPAEVELDASGVGAEGEKSGDAAEVGVRVRDEANGVHNRTQQQQRQQGRQRPYSRHNPYLAQLVGRPTRPHGLANAAIWWSR